ncbi:hypothetical protein L484_024638 [Morus notabilis]|uniref:Uncharacterized protein n=1 Tax=Morus notabilis TaxID=981085 RepID=W9R239_9ROSA|nr:hypothetical protein L484_024638 [Morus notabilis]
MFHSQGSSKQTCSLLVVTCGKVSESKCKKDVPENQPLYPFPELVSLGRLEVQTLTSPSKEEFSKLLESYKPNLVYLQGEQLGNDEVGPLVWGDVDPLNRCLSSLALHCLPRCVNISFVLVKFILHCCIHGLFSFANDDCLHFLLSLFSECLFLQIHFGLQDKASVLWDEGSPKSKLDRKAVSCLENGSFTAMPLSSNGLREDRAINIHYTSNTPGWLSFIHALGAI